MQDGRPRRLLGTLAALAALTASSLAVTGAAARAADAPPMRTVEVAYGDGPVTQTGWDEPIALSFVGTEGDRVGLESRLWPGALQ